MNGLTDLRSLTEMAVACPPATDHPQSGPSAAASQLNFPHNRLSPPEVEDNNLTLFLESLAKALKVGST